MWALALGNDDGDPEQLRERWSRKVERCEARLVLAEGRWVEVCEVPERGGRRRRALEKLIGHRARHSRARARLEALGTPSKEVQVFFATNRGDEDSRFGGWDGEALVWGIATVWIPADHPVGELEKDLAVVDVKTMPADEWHLELADASVNRGLLTYVHGYNNGFDYAARRTAQLSTDLDMAAVPVVFSWPSQGDTWFATAKYTFDENAAARSVLPFATFLGSVLAEQSAPVWLVAHSMGSRVVSDGLVDLERSGGLVRSIDELVFAAPDLDAMVYAHRYHQTALAASDRVTLYCAADDRALKLSRKVHGGYDRLGSCSAGSVDALKHPRIDVVDASELYVDIIDHDKVTSSPRLIRDLQLVLLGQAVSDPSRGLTKDGARHRLPP